MDHKELLTTSASGGTFTSTEGERLINLQIFFRFGPFV